MWWSRAVGFRCFCLYALYDDVLMFMWLWLFVLELCVMLSVSVIS